MTEFSNCSSLEDQVSSSNLGCLFHQNLCRLPCFIKIQRYLECSRSGCFWQKVGKMRKLRKRCRVNVGKNMQTIQLFVPQGKEQGNMFFQKGKNSDALKQYNG